MGVEEPSYARSRLNTFALAVHGVEQSQRSCSKITAPPGPHVCGAVDEQRIVDPGAGAEDASRQPPLLEPRNALSRVAGACGLSLLAEPFAEDEVTCSDAAVCIQLAESAAY